MTIYSHVFLTYAIVIDCVQGSHGRIWKCWEALYVREWSLAPPNDKGLIKIFNCTKNINIVSAYYKSLIKSTHVLMLTWSGHNNADLFEDILEKDLWWYWFSWQIQFVPRFWISKCLKIACSVLWPLQTPFLLSI